MPKYMVERHLPGITPDELSAAANIFLGRETRRALGLLDDRAMQQTAAGLLQELECDIHPRQPTGFIFATLRLCLSPPLPPRDGNLYPPIARRLSKAKSPCEPLLA